MPTTEEIKADKQVKYTGLWVGDINGNLPIAIFHPDVVEGAHEWAQTHFPENHIFASILIPERKLVTRSNIQGIKQFGANLCIKIASMEAKEQADNTDTE